MREIQVLQGVSEGAYFVCDRSERRSKACIFPFAEAKPIVKYSCTIAAGALNYHFRKTGHFGKKKEPLKRVRIVAIPRS